MAQFLQITTKTDSASGASNSDVQTQSIVMSGVLGLEFKETGASFRMKVQKFVSKTASNKIRDEKEEKSLSLCVKYTGGEALIPVPVRVNKEVLLEHLNALMTSDKVGAVSLSRDIIEEWHGIWTVMGAAAKGSPSFANMPLNQMVEFYRYAVMEGEAAKGFKELEGLYDRQTLLDSYERFGIDMQQGLNQIQNKETSVGAFSAPVGLNRQKESIVKVALSSPVGDGLMKRPKGP